MTDHPPRSRDPERFVSEEHERVRALADVLKDQEQRAEAARVNEERVLRRARVRRGALVGTWAAVAYVWLATPSWLTVEPPPLPTVTDEARSLRLNVFLQSQAIEAYRLERGRLPWVLQEAGPPFRGMEYRRHDGRTYELEARTDRVLLRYNSQQPPLEFVGEAADLLDDASADSRGAGQ
ncbi:MAG: hypothetical protein AMXMBFR53_20180 [Gemmatimonadota bacterium]